MTQVAGKGPGITRMASVLERIMREKTNLRLRSVCAYLRLTGWELQDIFEMLAYVL